MGRTVRTALVVVPTLAVLGAVALLTPGSTPLGARSAAAEGLTSYPGCEALLDAYRQRLADAGTPYGWDGGWGIAESGGGPVAISADASTSAAPAEAVGAGPTGTNLQEAGVDEPDVSKLAGSRLVTVAGDALRVLSTGPEPVLLGELALGEGGGAEVLLDGDRALVLQHSWASVPPGPDGGASLTTMPWNGAAGTTLRLADLSDPENPRWLESWTVEGGLVSARLVDGAVRVVTSTSPSPVPAASSEPYGPDQEQALLRANRDAALAMPLADVLPEAVRRDAAGAETSRGPAVACEDVSAPVQDAGTGLLVVTTLRPAQGLAPLDSTGVTADGDLVYATPDALVVATSRWGDAATQSATELHLFRTAGDATDYAGSGTVEGRVLGRWALSWHEDSLRVATTSDTARSSSVVVLQDDGTGLTEVGRVDGLGPDEQIQAVRYLGDLGVVVTFRQTDPLYVLDLSDPAAPRLTGELKVPGFSTYLHPIGADRLLGLGMEADPATGTVTGVQASVFDLSDRSAPVQVSRVQLGQGWSEAMQDSRAFTYDPARGLALLPMSSQDGSTAALGLQVGGDGSLQEAGRVPVRDSYAVRVLTDGTQAYAVGPWGVVSVGVPALVPTGSLRWG